MAFAAHLGEVPAEAWWLLLANVFWAIAYDTEYAMVDRDDDLRIGIKTSAITFGRFDVAAVMRATPRRWASSAGVGYRLHSAGPITPGWRRRRHHAGYHYTLIRGRERALLQGLPAQQLVRRGDLRRRVDLPEGAGPDFCPFSGVDRSSRRRCAPTRRPHMPPAMHGIGIDGHKAASEFAAAAKTGDRDKALALLPNLTAGCVACHFSYRTR
jgi:hypothetical protein